MEDSKKVNDQTADRFVRALILHLSILKKKKKALARRKACNAFTPQILEASVALQYFWFYFNEEREKR